MASLSLISLIAYSTSVTSTSRLDDRWRASHSTTGTPNVKVQCRPHGLRPESLGAIEAVHGDDERQAAALEVVN